jgi:membrane-associated protease RseP (regulator of RpoE activity)
MMTKTLFIPILTFALGLGLGALVFSAPSGGGDTDPPRPTAAVAPAPPPPSAAAAPEDGPTAAPVTAPETDGDAAASVPPVEATGPADEASAILDTVVMLSALVAADELRGRVEDLSAGWGRLEANLASLRQRITTLEQTPAGPPAETGATAADRPRTPEQQREALINAGVAADVADDILWRRAQQSLARLELRDRAIREDWLNTDRYREELARLNEQRVSLRDEVGSTTYDHYLYQTGQDNRIRIDSVIPGSTGEQSGLLPGDVIERYGEESIFNLRDLRTATSSGEREELVPVQVRRGDEMVELWLPRGPIGIRLDSARVDPDR